MRAGVTYSLRVRDVASGAIVKELPATHNLIMDIGLDSMAARSFVDCFDIAVVGTGTNPVSRQSGAITFIQTPGSNIVTASAPFFANTDVGYILKYGTGPSGVEQYITGYTDSTHVTVSSSTVTAASLAGTVWYVSQTTLQTQVKQTSTYAASGNGSAFVLGNPLSVYNHTRIFVFSAESGTITYNEIGWSWNGTNVFGRDLITPSGITLIAGQQLEATLLVSLEFGPCATIAQSDVSAGTWDTAGTALVEYTASSTGGGASPAFATIASNGATQGDGCLEAWEGVQNIKLISATWTQPSVTQNVGNPAGGSNNQNAGNSQSFSSYTPGSFTRSLTATADLGTSVGGPYYGIGMGGGGAGWCWGDQLTTPQSKDNSHTLSITFTWEWSRILVN